MKKIKTALLALVFASSVFAPFVFASEAIAINPLDGVCSNVSADSQICNSRSEQAPSLLGTVINTLLFIIGALSVIMIIVAGVLYTISGGDSGKVSKAKNTLTYAVVGLIVAFLAYAIVNWVFKLFDPAATPAANTAASIVLNVLK